MYLVHCFISMYSDPNKEVSTLVFFLDNQYTGAEFIYTRKPSLGSASDEVTCVISINKCLHNKSHSTRLRHVGWQCLLERKSKLRCSPIVPFEEGPVQDWVTWVKHHLVIVVPLGIGKHAEELSQMSFPGKGEMGRQHGYFKADIDMAELDRPP